MGLHPSNDRRSAAGLRLPPIVYERYPGAAAAPLPATYRRREPEKTPFYNIVREHLETFLEQARIDTAGQGYPLFVERQLRLFLNCGQLSRGFARLRCPDCGFERLVAFSCKSHICPSCLARRMSDTAADLRDRLLPQAPYRQWVMSFPWPMRLPLAYDKTLFSKILNAFLRTVFTWQRRRGRRIGIADGQTGAVSFLQRMGGALNLNPHIHSIQPDGLWTADPNGGPRLAFVPLPPPTDDDILRLTEKIARRLIKVVRRHFTDHMEQLLEVDAQQPVDDEYAALFNALAASLRAPVRFPPSPPLPGLKLDPSAPSSDHPHHPEQRPEHGPEPRPEHPPLCASVKGFSLHAGTAVSEHDRDGLERLCRYGLRAPFSVKRFSLLADGRVRYELRRPWPTPNGATELKLKPIELLRRLAALIPTPYTNLVRYHGVFANRSRFRKRLPPPPPSPHQPPPRPLPSADAPPDEPAAEPAPEPARRTYA